MRERIIGALKDPRQRPGIIAASALSLCAFAAAVNGGDKTSEDAPASPNGAQYAKALGNIEWGTPRDPCEPQYGWYVYPDPECAQDEVAAGIGQP